MENKKTKLTISGSPKKSFKKLDTSKAQGKKTVIIEKKSSKPFSKGSFNKPFGSKPSSPNIKHGSITKSNFPSKLSSPSSDFERRKLAEQRATKKLKGEVDSDKKTKLGTKKDK